MEVCVLVFFRSSQPELSGTDDDGEYAARRLEDFPEAYENSLQCIHRSICEYFVFTVKLHLKMVYSPVRCLFNEQWRRSQSCLKHEYKRFEK